MSAQKAIAIVGANSLQGEALLAVLEDQDFGFAGVHLLDVAEEAGGRLMLHGQSLRVEPLESFDFSSVAVALMALEPEQVIACMPRIREAGCIAVDASGALRSVTRVPLVVAAINPQALASAVEAGAVNCPDAQTLLTAQVVNPLLAEAGVQMLSVATYQSASTLGQSGLEALALQTGKLLNGQPADAGLTGRQMAFNLIPRLGLLDESGNTQDELRMVDDLRVLFDLPELPVQVTQVLVPVFYGSAQVIQVQNQEALEAARIPVLLRRNRNLKLLDKPADNGFPTPIEQASGSDRLWVGRIRQNPQDPRLLQLWAVADNFRACLAMNQLQVTQLLIKDFL